jgi:uncharacterized oxidoreductase
MSGKQTILRPEDLHACVVRIFETAGMPSCDAGLVADDLVDGDLCGLTSHGVFRVAQYIEAIQERDLQLGVELTAVRETPSTGVFDCGWNLGIVSGHQLVDKLIAKAGQTGLAAVVGTQCYHIGRLGNFTRRIAKAGYLGFVVAAGTARCHYVVPWGGKEGRLATNPMSYGVPCEGEPIVLDMSTSMYAEGKVRAARTLGKALPEGVIVDGHGRPSTDPEDFYGDPHGNILPFGGAMGYKGFGLGVLVEVLGRCLGGLLVSEEGDTYRLENGVYMSAMDPAAFCGRKAFDKAVTDLKDYITSCPPAPGHEAVLMPGGYDDAIRRKRKEDGIPLDPEVRKVMIEAAKRVGLTAAELRL